MDVDGPDSPIRSLRDFGIHIATVTLGILIALALEGLVQTWRDHELAVHAETDFRIEFSANRALLADDLQRSQALKAELEGLMAYGQSRLAGQPATFPSMASSRRFTQAQTTAWETATATQALLHIPFAEAGILSHAQHDQLEFNALQDRAEAQWFELAAYGNPQSLPPAQLSVALQKITVAYAYLISLQNAETTLIRTYDGALKALPGKAAS